MTTLLDGTLSRRAPIFERYSPSSGIPHTLVPLQALGQAVDMIVLGGVSDPTEAVPSLRLTGPGNLRICFVQQAE